MTQEDRPTRIKRLKMRSWRRGTKEMDMILGPYSDSAVPDLSDTDLDQYENLLNENDQDLYQWITGKLTIPDRFVPILNKIMGFHHI